MDYMGYKIFHFLETFSETRLLKMKLEWIRDDMNVIHLVNIQKVKYEIGIFFIIIFLFHQKYE